MIIDFNLSIGNYPSHIQVSEGRSCDQCPVCVCVCVCVRVRVRVCVCVCDLCSQLGIRFLAEINSTSLADILVTVCPIPASSAS